MAFGCMFFVRGLMVDFGFLRLANLFMECSCIAPFTLVVMVMSGLVCHPLFCMMLISGSYLLCLCVRAWSRESIMTVCEFYELDYRRGGR